MAKPLEITTRDLEDVQAQGFELRGYLDAGAVPAFDEGVTWQVVKGEGTVVIFMENLEYVSSAGIGALMGLDRQLREQGGKLILFRPPGRVRKIFDMLGLTRILKVADSTEQMAEMAGVRP